MSKFFQENNQLIIASNLGRVTWKGQPFNWPVSKVIELPENESAIVLLNYYQWDESRGFNLVKIDKIGKVLWQATEKTGQMSKELISDIQLKENILFANTWNGDLLKVDKETGSLTPLCFTK